MCRMGNSRRHPSNHMWDGGSPTGAKHWLFYRFPKAEISDRESEARSSTLMEYAVWSDQIRNE